MKCPDCLKGQIAGIACGPKIHCSPMVLKCFRCGGSGNIPDEMGGWIKIGKQMRENRLKRDISLREEAKRLGILPSVLSQMENGRINPIEKSPGRPM
jgi:hypothetical protein